MSFSGKLTPLQLNVVGELSNDSGLIINSTATENQGQWTPNSYTQGTVTGSTVLDPLTRALPLLYTAAAASTISRTLYRAATTIGASRCSALGNSRPASFVPTYPGYGSWTGTTLNQDNYPPKNYPTAGTYSYIKQTYGSYAYVTGWPGRNSWQKTTDTYIAAVPDTDEADAYFQNGFIGTIARQAYYELWGGTFSRYNNIVNSFQQNSQWRTQTNQKIASFVNTKTFLSGNFSNINDLSTNDISGVNQAFNAFGTDLVNLGNSIDLTNIYRFGTPSVLLQTIQKSGALNDAIRLALGICGLTDSAEIISIMNNEIVPSPDQEKKIYQAFTLIKSEDIYNPQTGVAAGLNLKTQGLETLADLLNPVKMFPNSCNSLTMPEYAPNGANSKVYHFIYKNNGANINPSTLNAELNAYLSSYLVGILPSDIAVSCGAFGISMGQISNIFNVTLPRLAQAVLNLELTNRNLPLVNSGTGVPGNVSVANQILGNIALGSGNSGSYRQCDFYGAASGFPYNNYYDIIKRLLNQLPTAQLKAVYDQIYTASLTPSPSTLTSLITQANAIIDTIYTNNQGLCIQLNYYWSLLGTQLAIEQRAIPYSIPVTTTLDEQIDTNDFYNFAASLDNYAIDNGDGENAKTLEAISNVTTIGGQSLIASMREARNAARLNIVGAPPSNDVSNEIDICSASAKATLTDGKITAITVTSNGTGYTNSKPPKIYITPAGFGAKLTPLIAPDGSIARIDIVDQGANYTYAELTIEPPPQCQPGNIWTDIIPPTLVNPASNSPTVSQAIEDVTKCNCDCWT